jgi:eukaryotic-like serine/threonine-protein kinase
MSHHPSICEPARISLFLDQQLSDVEQAEFERHLETCDACRHALEECAARPDTWQSVRESLSDDSDPAASDPPHSSISPDLSLRPSDDNTRFDPDLKLLAPSDDPAKLGRLGTYEITGVIGRGGMGVVFKGFDASLNRFVAIKVLAPHLAASGSARRRFEREAQAAAAVTHENVIAIHGVSEWNGLPYLVMPYVRGHSLQKRLDREGPLGVAEILRIGRQIASGLAAAHAQGLVHRDIKPANILLEDGVERLQITDFGLARAVDDASLTRTGVIAGTPQYMSPEQARGESIDARSDLFSLGSVLYALCTGRPPFRAETSYGILRRITDTVPRTIQEINPAIPDWLAAIVSKLHAKEPSERFGSAAELATLLEQCLAHVQQPGLVALPEPCRKAAGHSRRAMRLFAWGGGAAVLCVIALLIGAAVRNGDQPTSGSNMQTAGVAGEPRNSARGPSEFQPTTADSAAWNDGIDAEIRTLSLETERLHHQAQRLWDDDETIPETEQAP